MSSLELEIQILVQEKTKQTQMGDSSNVNFATHFKSFSCLPEKNEKMFFNLQAKYDLQLNDTAKM